MDWQEWINANGNSNVSTVLGPEKILGREGPHLAGLLLMSSRRS